MPKQIDWLYHRKSCITCKRAEACRDKLGATVKELVDARKIRYGKAEALALLDGIDKVIVMRGTSVERYFMDDPPDDAVLLAQIMGPTGNLRAPTARVGRTLVVGFDPGVYAEVLK